MIGHPLIFLEDGLSRVELVKGKPELRIKKQKTGKILLELSLELDDLREQVSVDWPEGEKFKLVGQASDRAHRIGQQRPVTIYRLVAGNTIEEKIVHIHNQKRDLADGLLQGTDINGKISGKELLALITNDV